jgi:signal transduction histidine kinase
MLRSVVNCIRDAIFVLSVDGNTLMMNSEAEKLKNFVEPGTLCRQELDGTELTINVNNEKRIFLLSLSEVISSNSTTGYVLMLKDITEKRQREAIEERNKRLIAMGEMMASIVHEMRNPLCSIELYASMLHKELEGTGLESLSKGVSTGVRSLNNILSNMLYFAKPRTPRMNPVSLAQFVEETLEMVRPVAESRMIVIKNHIQPLSLCMDDALVRQVCMNILLNAVQAMSEGGTITVSTELKDRALYIHIKDTGCGMDEQTLERIFDPFYTTKDEGTGLGLSISLKIMQSHGGTINVRSTPGRGTVFSLVFPENLIITNNEKPKEVCLR